MYKFSKNSLRRLDTCECDLQNLAKSAVINSPYDFMITHGHRTPEEQKALYDQGRTASGNIVTNCDGTVKKSKHNYLPSQAFDIAILVNGKVTWDVQYYKIVGNHIIETAKKLGIKVKWPINIGKKNKPVYDWPHFEI